MNKVCSKCGLEKDLDQFNNCIRSKYGKKPECRECQKKYTKEYLNRPEIIARNSSPEHVQQKNQNQRKRRGNLDFQERSRAWARDRVLFTLEATLIKAARKRAKRLGVLCILAKEDVIIPKLCPILGTEFERGSGKIPSEKSPSLDRIIPELGYVKGNVAVISHRANRIKNSGNAEEHRKVAEWIDSFPPQNPRSKNNKSDNDLNVRKEMLSKSKSRAKMKGVSFSLSLDDIYIPKVCPVLGIPIRRGNKVCCNNSPTLDKIDPSLGYVPENVAVISLKANAIKGDGTAAEHRLIADWINKMTHELVEAA